MNTHRAIWALVLSIFLLSGVGPVGSPTTPAGDNPLDQMAWLVGGTWVAETKAPDGSPVTIEVTCHWAKHKKLITYSIIKKYGKKAVPSHEGVYGWHPGKKQLVLWQMDNEGNLTEGVLIINGNKQSFENLLYRTDGTTQPQRAQVIREGADVFVFKASIRQEGEWLEVVSIRYKRVR